MNFKHWEDNEISRLRAQLAERDKTITYLRGQVTEAEKIQNETVDEILNLAPECWDGDEAACSLAINFVKSLTSNTTEMTGHRDGCNCWE